MVIGTSHFSYKEVVMGEERVSSVDLVNNDLISTDQVKGVFRGLYKIIDD